MTRKNSIIAAILLSLILPTFVFAETIVLKSGKQVEGKIIEKTEDYIKIDFLGTPLTYYLENVENIDGESLISSSSKIDNEPLQEDTIYREDIESQKFSTKPIENTLNEDYSHFDMFKIRVPREWTISQKKVDITTQIRISEPDTVYGLIISYNPSRKDPYEVYEDDSMYNFEQTAKNYLKRYGTIVNTLLIKTRFQESPALEFNADIPYKDIRIGQTIFIKGSYAFTLNKSMPISRHEVYNTVINDSLSTFELTPQSYNINQQESPESEEGGIFWIVVAFLCAPLCYYLAKSKNISWPIMWAIFGLLLSIIPAIILLIVPKRIKKQRNEEVYEQKTIDTVGKANRKEDGFMKKRDVWTIVFVACLVFQYLMPDLEFVNLFVRPALVILLIISIVMFFKYKNK